MEQLADQEAAIDYLQVTLEEYQNDGDMPFFLREVQRVVEAQGGIVEIAKKIDVKPEALSNVLSSDEAPRIDTLSAVLTALGCRLSIQPIETENASVEHSAERTTTAPLENAGPSLEVTTGSRDSGN